MAENLLRYPTILFDWGDTVMRDHLEITIPMVEWDEPVEMAFAELERTSALVVTKAGQALGVLTRSDLLEFLARQRRA